MKNVNRNLLVVFMMLAPVALFASENAQEPNAPNVWSNPLFLTLSGVMLVLALLIGVLGGVILNFLKYKYKAKKEHTRGASVVLFIAFTAWSQDAAAASSSIAGIHATAFWIMVSAIIAELFIIAWFILVLYRLIAKEEALSATHKKVEKEASKPKEAAWYLFWRRINDYVEIEQEKDVLLDHEYDGIKELDNNLPPWWKYGFYLTIVIGIGYLLRFYVFGGPSSAEEYQRSVERAEIEIAAYRAQMSDMVDEETVVMLSGADDLLAGKEYFLSKCAVCHGPEGQGSSMAPNLTDEYWIHGGSINDVFATIKYGVTGKGMQSWRNEFAPKEIAQIASYIMSLQGTNPDNPWEPQGTLYVPEKMQDDNAEEEPSMSQEDPEQEQPEANQESETNDE